VKVVPLFYREKSIYACQDGRPSMSIKSDMPYCSAFIEEVARYRTLVPLSLFHKTTEDVMLNGYLIAKGTTVRKKQVETSGFPPWVARAGGRAPRTPRPKRGPQSDRVPLLRHIETPELNSPRTDFTHFPFQYSCLSNTSKKFIFPQPIIS